MSAAGGEGGGEGGGGGMGGGGMQAGALAQVRFQTALPIKQALLKQKFGSEVGTAAQAQEILKGQDQIYLVVLEGLPQRMAQMGGEKLPAMLKRGAMLKRTGEKAPIAAAQVEVGTIGKKIVVYYAFPRTDAITLEEKDIEFISKMGPIEFKRKFKLADMVFDGKLTL